MKRRGRDYKRGGVSGGLLDDYRLRIFILALLILAAFLILAGRLFYLQLYHGEEHRRKIARQSIRRIRIPGLRGRIYSSDRLLLAGNRATYDLVFYPEEMHRGDRRKTITRMYVHAQEAAKIIGRQLTVTREKISRHLWVAPGMPFAVFQDLNAFERARALEYIRKIDGADLQLRAVRVYPQGKFAAHLIGFTGMAEAQKESDREDFFYYRPDMIGRAGIEAGFDRLSSEDGAMWYNHNLGLRAFPGRQVVQVNNFGFVHKELLGKAEPVYGNDVILTIDSKAQYLAENLLKGCVGAFVVTDADTGDIICSASSPGYDLARFVPRLPADYYRELLKSPDRPLVNRALTGIYPPGSTLKPLICLAFIKAGIDPDEKIDCPGRVRIGNASVGCLAHPYGASDTDMREALEKSCNGYMILQALKVGFPVISDLLRSAGIGRKSGIELAESAGSFPSDELKRKLYKARWNDYDTALLSIGQGLISMTPLQMALYTAAVANGGKIYQPHLVAGVCDSEGNFIRRREIVVKSELDCSPEALKVIREGMFRVVNAPRGSGRRGRVEGLTVYGKTGTAEVGPRSDRRNMTHFIAFTEYNGRRYAASMTIEDGLSGGRTCAPLVAAFFDHYLLDGEK